jgi:hypothetical protein
MGKKLKIYKISDSYTRLCMPVKTDNGRELSVEFKGTHRSYVTDDATTQKLIEATVLFRDGVIYLSEEFDSGQEQLPKDAPKKTVEVYADVSLFQEAAEILISKGVSDKNLSRPDTILKAAKRVNISFPALESMLAGQKEAAAVSD